MEHEQANNLFEAYFSNRMDRAAVREFHKHINDCEDCKVRLRSMRANSSRIFSPGFSTRRLGRDPEEDRLQATLVKNRIITYAVIAAMVVFFFLFILKKGG